LETRLESEVFDPLIGFLAFLVPKLSLRNNKLIHPQKVIDLHWSPLYLGAWQMVEEGRMAWLCAPGTEA